MTEPVRRRRSLTHVGGDIETEGAPEEAARLASALEVDTSETLDAPERAHVHGFHSYPARAHPDTVRSLIGDFVPDGGTVLDPFCGSGTVLVESILCGKKSLGTDLNPLAVRLTSRKIERRDPEELEALVEAAREVAAGADARRKAKAGGSRRYGEEDVAAFDPHVLLELDGLRVGVEAIKARGLADDLSLVLSAILVKVSRRRGDTSELDAAPKRIAAGYPAKLFVKKAIELAERLRAFRALAPEPWCTAHVMLDDATRLTRIRPASIDAVISSPPYAATYDYLQHHAMRMRWLGLDTRGLDNGEMGARRAYRGMAAADARRAWGEELMALLSALSRVMKPGAPLVLLVADSAVGSGREVKPLRADDMVPRAAHHQGDFEPIARASQARPHFHPATALAFAKKPRFEHALLLCRR